jgi:hypothetical protein
MEKYSMNFGKKERVLNYACRHTNCRVRIK